ncbi:peptidylprolyl isomerase [Chloroflexota bacterium]
MTKKRVEKPKREFSRHQLSHFQMQKRRQRFILGIGISIISVVLGIVGVGWYLGEHQPRQQTVIKVNETEFEMDYFVKMLQFYGEGYDANFMLGIVDDVVRGIEQNELIWQEAAKLGVTVSDSEVDDELGEREPAISRDYRDLVRTEMLMSRLIDGYFDEQVPLSTGQKHIMAMFLESERQVAEVSARLEDGEDFGQLAGEFSLEALSQSEGGDLGWRPRGILPLIMGTAVPEDYAFGAEVEVLSQPLYDEAIVKHLGYWLIEVLEIEEEPQEAHGRVILLPSEEEAESARVRLEDGEDFTALVAELSHHDYSKEKEGDLGWLTPEEMSPVAEEFVFGAEMELGIVSEPLRDDSTITRGGYWLVKIAEEDDDLEIPAEYRELLKSEIINEWLASLWENPENEIEDYLDGDQKTWAAERAARG